MAFGICLVGTGGIASAHADAFQHTTDVQQRWVVGRQTEAAEEFAHKWGFARSGTTLADALADSQVDAVLIASPSQLHAEHATQALEAGKHVIVEIPAAIGLEHCEGLTQLALASRRRIYVCHTMRSFPSLREIRAQVADGRLEVTQIIGFFAIPRRANEGWHGTRNWVDNLLWHHACHQVDASLWVLGIDNFENISAHFGRAHEEFGMVMDLSLSFTTSAAQLVTHTLTYNTGELVWELRFVTNGEQLTFRNGGLFNHAGHTLGPPVSIRDLTRQNEEIFASLRSGAASEFDLTRVMPAMRLLDAAENAGNVA